MLQRHKAVSLDVPSHTTIRERYFSLSWLCYHKICYWHELMVHLSRSKHPNSLVYLSKPKIKIIYIDRLFTLFYFSTGIWTHDLLDMILLPQPQDRDSCTWVRFFNGTSPTSFCLFSVFSCRYQFFNEKLCEMIHIVCSPGIRTDDDLSLLPWPLDQVSLAFHLDFLIITLCTPKR